MKLLVLDIEAIRDESLWSPPADNPDAFAPVYAWRPICIGLVGLKIEGGNATVTKVGCVDVPKDCAADDWERALLGGFAGVMAKGAPELVTWNGRRFDLPVLMLRSLRHGIAHPWYYQGRDVRYRYSEHGHCDLADHMGDFGTSLPLDAMARLIGLPGKFGDIDGPGVAAAFAAGRHQDIATYCTLDAVQTAALYLRWLLLKGELELPAYQRAAMDLMVQCNAQAHLAPLVARIDRRVLLLEQAQEAAA